MVQKCLKDLVRVSNETRGRVTISYTYQSRFCGIENSLADQGLS